MKGITVLLFVVGVALSRAQVEQCPTEQESDWTIEKLLRHEDCHKFYKCYLGTPIAYTCPDDLYFNLEEWKCDWPENVDCEGRNDPATATPELTTTTPEPTTTTPEPTTTTPEPTTTTPEPTTTTPEPTTTTPEPTTTTPEPTTTTTTPEPTTTTTTPEPTTTTTTAAPTTTTAAATDAPEVELEFLPNGCPVDPHVHWLLPNVSDCCLFYYCVWGELVPRECPAGLHFNPTLQVCDWPISAGCRVSANKHSEARRYFLKQILA